MEQTMKRRKRTPAEIVKTIRFLLKEKNITIADISRGLRVPQPNVSAVLLINKNTQDFTKKLLYIRQGIAQWLGIPYHEVWDATDTEHDTFMREMDIETFERKLGEIKTWIENYESLVGKTVRRRDIDEEDKDTE